MSWSLLGSLLAIYSSPVAKNLGSFFIGAILFGYSMGPCISTGGLKGPRRLGRYFIYLWSFPSSAILRGVLGGSELLLPIWLALPIFGAILLKLFDGSLYIYRGLRGPRRLRRYFIYLWNLPHMPTWGRVGSQWVPASNQFEYMSPLFI